MHCPEEFVSYTMKERAKKTSQEFLKKNVAPSWSFELQHSPCQQK